MIYRDGVKWSAAASVFSGFQDVVEVGIPADFRRWGVNKLNRARSFLLAAVVSRKFLLQDVDPEIQASEHQDRHNHHDQPINQSLVGANLQVLVTLHLIRKNVKHDPSLPIRRDCAGRHPVMTNEG